MSLSAWRIERQLKDEFEAVSVLSGRPAAQVLSKLIREHIATFKGSAGPTQAAQT